MATLLGGLSALWLFLERFMPATRQLSAQGSAVPEAAKKQRNGVVRLLQAFPMSTTVALGLQWVLTVYVLSYHNRFLSLFGLLLPIWIVPLAILICKFVTADAGAVRIVGGALGGIVSAAIAYAMMDWAARYGLVTGIFFGTLVAGHVASPERMTSLFSLIVGTLLLLFGLGVFEDLRWFMQFSGEGFILAAFAVVFWLYFAAASHLPAFKRFRRQNRKRSKPQAS